MAIPDYQTIMLPVLKLAGDGKPHRIREAIELLTDEFNLSAEEQRERLPSGKQRTFANRVGWARTYLKKAGLLVSPTRGHFQITDRGASLLSENLDRLSRDVLMQFEEFRDFQKQGKSKIPDEPDHPTISDPASPLEQLETSYTDIRKELASELLGLVRAASPQFFERLVVELLVAMGYGGSFSDAAQVIGGSGDEGIDGVIKQDRLGLDVIYIQAKRWENSVGRPVVQTFAGSLEGARARRGVILTTSTFSRGAQDYVNKIEKKIVLIDGDKLAELMIDHNVGVSLESSYDVKKIDIDFFEDD